MASVSAPQSSSFTLTSPLNPLSEKNNIIFHTLNLTCTTRVVNVEVVLQERQDVRVAVCEAVGGGSTGSAQRKPHQTHSTAQLQDTSARSTGDSATTHTTLYTHF